MKVDMAYDIVFYIGNKYESAKKSFSPTSENVIWDPIIFIRLLEKAIALAQSASDESFKSTKGDTVKIICNQCYLMIVDICVDVCKSYLRPKNVKYYYSLYENYRDLLKVKLPNYRVPNIPFHKSFK